MRMLLPNPVMFSACARLSRREGYQIIAFSLKVSVFGSMYFCRFPPEEQACVQRQVCHLIGVIVAKELMGGDQSCQKWGLEWECLSW